MGWLSGCVASTLAALGREVNSLLVTVIFSEAKVAVSLKDSIKFMARSSCDHFQGKVARCKRPTCT